MLKGHVAVEELKANAFILQKQRQHCLNFPDDDDSFFNFFFKSAFFQPPRLGFWVIVVRVQS